MPIYIIDLTRSKGKFDNEQDLLSVIEDLKSGFLTSPMYGRNSILMMDPPHLIISSNSEMDYSLLSHDRWKIFTINENYKLKEKSYKFEKMKE